MAGIDERRVDSARELEVARERLQGLDPQIAQAGSEVETVRVERDAAQKELEGWQSQVDSHAAALAAAEADAEARRRQTTAAAEAGLIASREAGIRGSDLTRQVNDFSSFMRTLDRDLKDEAAGLAEVLAIETEVVGQSQRAGQAREAAAAAQAAQAALRQRQAELAGEVLRLHAEVSGAKARTEALEAQGGQNPYWTGAQAVLSAGIEGVVGSVRSLIKVDESARPFVEDLLGERLFAVVCENSNAARAGVEFLQAAGKGRARFLVLSTLSSDSSQRSYPEEARPLLRHIQCEPRHEAAVRFLFSESYTLGKVLFGDHWVCGGAQPGAGVQLSLSDIEELRARLAMLEAQSAQRAAEAQRCVGEAAAAEQALHDAFAAVSVETERSASLGRRLKEKRDSLGLTQQNVALGMEQATGALRGVALIKEELRDLCARQNEAVEKERACRAVEGSALALAQAAKDALVEKRATQKGLNIRIEGLDREMAIRASSYERLSESKKHAEATVADRGRELADLARRRQEAGAAKDQARQQIQVLNGQLAAHENGAASILSLLQDTEKALAERSQSLQTIKAEQETAQQELHDLELRRSGHQTRQEMLRTQLWDQWQLPLEDARAKYGAVVVDVDKLETLRKRIAGMGPINQGAPEEYEALAQRQSFLTAQISDLTQAKDDLKAAIQKINATTRENFRQTFSETREHFQRLYGVLFEGGEADLVLTNPDDILETGVEIVAQPPGKRLQSITLLSGGEKTMTAIALLFAFFMVRPAPFCMLDEADAALDDANVERFVAMIKEFGTRTQFLIISHNKGTMEAADVIYGVTMEEKGVSQIVSIEFEKRARTHAPAVRKPEPEAAPKPQLEAVPVVQESLPLESHAAATALENVIPAVETPAPVVEAAPPAVVDSPLPPEKPAEGEPPQV